MKKRLFAVFFLFIFIGLFLHFGCKSEEAFIWDPTGTWDFTFDAHDPSCPPFTNALTLTGSDSVGIVSGLTWDELPEPFSGSYNKTGDFSLAIHFDFEVYSVHVVIDIILASTEADPNTMNGDVTFWQEDLLKVGYLFPDMTVTATKTTNLQ